MIIMSLRAHFAKQPSRTGDCFVADCAPRNDMVAKVNALRELQSASGEELRPLFGSPSGVDVVPEQSEWDAVHFG